MKKIFLVLLVLALITMPVFAAGVDGQVTKNTVMGIDLTVISRVLTLIVGVFGGGIILIKTAIELIHAVTNQEQDPQGIRKCIIRLVISVMVIGGFFGIRSWLISGTGKTTDNNGGVDKTATGATDVFYEVMGTAGAEVEDEAWRSVFILED